MRGRVARIRRSRCCDHRREIAELRAAVCKLRRRVDDLASTQSGQRATPQIKVRPGDVMEWLHTFDVTLDSDPGRSLLGLARDLRESGWWPRLDALSSRYATFIAYEA